MTLDGISQTPEQPGIVPGPVEAPDPSNAALDALEEEKTEGDNWIAKDGASDPNYGNEASNGATIEAPDNGGNEGLWTQQEASSNVRDNNLSEQVQGTFNNTPETSTISAENAPEIKVETAIPATETSAEAPINAGDSAFTANSETAEPLPSPDTVEIPDTVTDEMEEEVRASEIETPESPEEKINTVEDKWIAGLNELKVETDTILADLEKRAEEIRSEYEPRITEEKQKAEDAHAEIIRLENELGEKLGGIDAAKDKANRLISSLEGSEKPESLIA